MRDPRPGNYSIEQIFEEIRKELSNRASFQIFFAKKPLDWHSILRVKQYSSDINHFTGDANYLALGVPRRKTILTVHDIGYYDNTLAGLKKYIYGLIWFQIPLRKVEKITTISNFTADNLINHFGVSSSKIEVIPNPLFPEFITDLKEINHEFPTILQIGSGHNKNLDRLIEAVKGLPCKLLLIRRPDLQLKQKLDAYNIAYEWRSNISIGEMVNAYKESDVVFFASTYEGFGMPIIEAQGVGRPVITSNIPPMSQISGVNGALLVDAFSVADIRKGIMKIMNSKTLTHELIINGFQNIQKYSLSKIADQYFSLYQMLS